MSYKLTVFVTLALILAGCDQPPARKSKNSAQPTATAYESSPVQSETHGSTASSLDFPLQSDSVASKKNAVHPWPGQTKADEHELFGATDEEAKFVRSLDRDGKRRVQRLNAMRENLEFHEIKSDLTCPDQKIALNQKLDALLAALTSAQGKVDENYDRSLSDLEIQIFALRTSCNQKPIVSL